MRVPSLTNAASLSPSVPVYACLGANGGRYGIPRNDLPAMPTVEAGSSQRENSPAHCLHMRTPCHTWRWAVFTTTRRAASLSAFTSPTYGDLWSL